MSQYGIIYRMEFKNAEGFTIRVNGSPTDVLIGDLDTPVIIPLTGSGNPVVISVQNNSEDKFTPIRSKSARIQFLTDSVNGVNSATFSQGGDNLWVWDVILQDTPQYIFRGFQIMADIQQPFQPDPQYVTLTATDHLGALKELPMQDLLGDNPTGKYRVADLINFCLRKTGLTLDFFVVNNLRAGGGQFTNAALFSSAGNYIVTNGLVTNFFYPGQEFTVSGTATHDGTYHVKYVVQSTVTEVHCVETISAPAETVSTTFTDTVSASHWYDVVYLDAKTFEAEIGVSENCYSVLEKILGEDCFITQWHGSWWIFRVDEMEDNPLYIAEFTSAGVYVSTATDTIDKSIGINEDIKFANADTLLRFVRPHGYVKEKMTFETPLEIPCNSAFIRGDLIDGSNQFSKTYALDCWSNIKVHKTNGTESSEDTATRYIRRIFDANNFETERYAVLTGGSYSVSNYHAIKSEAIPLGSKDKFTLSFSWKMTIDMNIVTYRSCLLKFVANSGTVYYWTVGLSDNPLDGLKYKWRTSPVAYFSGGVDADSAYDDYVNDWQNLSVSVDPVPDSGELFVYLYNHNRAIGSQPDTWFTDLSFEYIPYIDGTYQKYSGYYNQVDRTQSGYFANREKDVYIGDLPRPIFKGGMFRLVSSDYVLVPVWFAAAPFGNSYPPDTTYLHPYGWIQAYSVWNQYKGYNNSLSRGIGINIFSGSVVGLTDAWPDLLHRYELTDFDLQTINRYFILISFEQNWKTCLWSATFIEVYNRVILKSYSDSLTFKYLEQ